MWRTTTTSMAASMRSSSIATGNTPVPTSRPGRRLSEEAQAAKKRHIAAKLKLDRPGLEVLDIGSGRGGMALTLARATTARVSPASPSPPNSWMVARARAAEAGLAADRVRFELMDYRARNRPVDRTVSGRHVPEHARHRPPPPPLSEVVRDSLPARRRGADPTPSAVPTGPAPPTRVVSQIHLPGRLFCRRCRKCRRRWRRPGCGRPTSRSCACRWRKPCSHRRSRFAGNRDAIASLYDERFCRMF